MVASSRQAHLRKGGLILRRLLLIVLILTGLSIFIPASQGETSGKWRVKINIPATTMFVYKDGQLWKQIDVAVGRIEKQTPIGNFRIISKVKDPIWYPEGESPVLPGPDNPLGRYWLGLNLPGYGIHGNNNPLSIGYWVSSGCVRVKNEEVELLFQNLPVGTEVEIVYEPVNLLLKQDRLWLDLYPDIYRLVPDMRQLVRETVKIKYPRFNLHDDGLWHVIGEHRPALLELPEAVELYVDGEKQQAAAFRWGEQVFLPDTVYELWGEGKRQKFPELWEFLMDNSGKAFGVWDEQTNSIRMTTIRLSFEGRILPVRGWLREEPFLAWDQLYKTFQKSTTLPEKSLLETGAPGENLEKINPEALLLAEGVHWISLTKLQQVCPGYSFEWNEDDWRIEIRIKK